MRARWWFLVGAMLCAPACSDGGGGSGGSGGAGGAGGGGGAGVDPVTACAELEQQNAGCWPADGDAACIQCLQQCGGQCAILESCPIQFACP